MITIQVRANCGLQVVTGIQVGGERGGGSGIGGGLETGGGGTGGI